ncbi:TonB-dependent receptor [Phenylobacterium sp.]|uniref:TonB-dependent receptor n=1 Tax=Phenylobacterium sp. TaxID=1871053 RepID=UPI00398388B4
MNRTALLSSAAAFALLAFGTAAAQQAGEPVGLAEVVVTAQKRVENVQDVPISVTAFNSETLKAAGVNDVRDLRRITPNLNLTTSSQQTNTRVMIRGIGTAGNTAIEPSVASFVDGIYIPRVGSLLAGLNDISSVEVLRGPQGTLFGRNASMGAILLRTTEPQDTLGGELFASVGDYGRRRLSATVNVPINESLAGRVSVLGYRAEGYGVNDLTGRSLGRNDGFSVRGAVRWEITPEVTWVLRGDSQHLTGDGNNTVTVVAATVSPQARINWQTRLDPDGAGPLTGDLPYLDDTYRRNVRQESEGDLADYQTGVASDLTWDLPGDYQLKLISGYRDWHNDQYQVSTGSTPLALSSRLGTFDSQSHSQELQLLSPETLMNGRASFVSGLYYFEEEYDIGQVVNLYPSFCEVFIRNTSTAARLAACRAAPLTNASLIYFDQTTESYAAYAQGTFNVTEQLGLTAGIRYSKDDKSGRFRAITNNSAAAQSPENTALALEEDKITYRLNATYRPADGIMLFTSYSTGFKSGGFDTGAGTTGAVGAAGRTFKPESTTNIELGAKSALFDRRLIANLTFYRTEITEYQFRTYDGAQFRVRNNGEVRQQGFEVDMIARPIPPLTLTFSTAYLDSQYTDFRGAPPLPAFTTPQDLTGQRLPYSPQWQGAASAQYVGDLSGGLSWVARGDMSFTTETNLSASGDNNPQAAQEGYSVFALRFAIRGPDQKWEVAIAAQNLTDETFCLGIFNQPSNGPFGLNNAATGGTVLRCTLNEPRNVALELKARF